MRECVSKARGGRQRKPFLEERQDIVVERQKKEGSKQNLTTARPASNTNVVWTLRSGVSVE